MYFPFHVLALPPSLCGIGDAAESRVDSRDQRTLPAGCEHALWAGLASKSVSGHRAEAAPRHFFRVAGQYSE